MLYEKIYNFRIHLKAVILACLHGHADTAVGLEGTLKRLVGLKTNNGFFILI